MGKTGSGHDTEEGCHCAVQDFRERNPNASPDTVISSVKRCKSLLMPMSNRAPLWNAMASRPIPV